MDINPILTGLNLSASSQKKEHLESTKELTLSNSPLAAERAHSRQCTRSQTPPKDPISPTDVYIKGSLKWIVEESEVHFCFSGPIDVAAECLVISVAFALCLIVVKKEKKKENTERLLRV